MDKNKRREIIGKALEVVRRACGGEVKGYAEGGSPKSILSEATRSPVPDWLMDQQRSVRDGMPMPEGVERRFPSGLFEPFADTARMGAELTGVPSVYRGVERLTDPNSDGWGKARGVGDVLMGAMPGVGATGRGARALAELYATAPRTIATSFGLAIPGVADMIAHPAAAQTMTADKVKELQTELKLKGYYKGKIDGNPGGETARAAEAYRLDQEKHAAVAAKDKERDAQMAGTQAQSERARADAEIAKAKALEIAAKQKSDETKDINRKAGEERLRDIDANTAWYNPNRMLRDYGPAAGYLAGAIAGPLAAKGVSGVLDKVAKNAATRANGVLNSIGGAEPNAAASKLNQFWTEGQSRPLVGNRGAPYTSNPTTGELSANASAPAASELYLPDRMRSMAANAVPLGGFAGEAVLGQGVMMPEAKTSLEAAKKAVAEDPSDINIAAYQKALGSVGTAEFLSNMGRAGALGYAGTSLMAKPTRDRPDISRAEQARFDLDALLARQAGRGSTGAPANPTGPTSTLGQTPAPSSTVSGSSSPKPGSSSQAGKGQSKSVDKSTSSSELPEWASAPPDGVKLKRDHYWDKNLNRPRHVADGKFAEMPRYSAKSSSKGKQPTSEPTNEAGGFDPLSKPSRPLEEALDPSNSLTKGLNTGGPVVEMARRYADGGVAGLMRYADGGVPELGAMPPPGPMDEPEGPLIPHGPVHGPDGGRADTRPVSVPDGAYVMPADIVAALGEGNTQSGFKSLDDMFGTAETMHMADGGVPERAVPIRISDGEYVISPAKVAEIGNGDIDVGHKALDKFVMQLREQNIKKLQSLPGPAQN